MISFIDSFLNKITMYRLVLYCLFALVGIAVVYSFLGILPFSALFLFLAFFSLMVLSWGLDMMLGKIFRVPTNVESSYITPLILLLIVTPPSTWSGFFFLGVVCVIALASKYVLVFRKKHLFNPAACAVVITGLVMGQGASWWVGTSVMAPFLILFGILIVRKLRQFAVVGTLCATIVLVNGFVSGFSWDTFSFVLERLVIDSPLLFFATIMFTEPTTMPPRRYLRVGYAGIVGLLFTPGLALVGTPITPEMALLVGNMFSFLVIPKVRQSLRLIEKKKNAPHIYEFVFEPERKFPYMPGQYMEWTLLVPNADTRGNRRYFTIASSPTEEHIRLGIKTYEKPSTFKQALLALEPTDTIIGSQLAGDFVLPKDPSQPCVLIAGGIGITPYRSMIKYLLDRKEKRPITIFYAANSGEDFAYRELFAQAEQELGIRTIYVVSNAEHLPKTWKGETGFITQEMIRKYIPNVTSNHFYISGPRSMIVSFQALLREMGIHRRTIKTDFFPGFV